MTRKPPSVQTDTEHGFSLMELVVVLMVFALVATFSLQALSGTLRSRDRLVELDNQTRDSTLALSLLRADLNAAVPLAFRAPSGSLRSAFEISPAQDQLAISVSGRSDLTGENNGGLGRVIWQFDANAGTLSRQSWPVLAPLDGRSQGPMVVMARGVTDMKMRTMIPQNRWISGTDPTISGTSTSLPRAVDVLITTEMLGTISTLVAYP